MGIHTDTGWEWNFIWRRSLFDNEIDMANSFLGDIEGSVVQPKKMLVPLKQWQQILL